MDKSADAFRTISEVAEDLDLPQHVLRFWETRFKQIKPMKRGGGRRYYRPDDVDLLRGIKGLLYDEGYTIRGVQRLLKEHGNRVAIEFGLNGTLDLSVSEGTVENGIDNQPVGATAVNVSELERSEGNSKQGSGLIGRIVSRATAAAGPEVDAELAKDDFQALKSTLQELLECKRLLDQTRQT